MSPNKEKKTSRKAQMQLTSRQKEIIQILTRFTASRPVTVSVISDMMGVSSRTILREMPHIERWLTQNDFHFVRKPGVGLLLEESVENQKLILELLEIEPIQKEYAKEERQRRILGELLYAQEPLKSYAFTSKFHISEGTLSSDLDAIGKWLERYRIRLVRRPGVGILLAGEESRFREAIAGVVYESMDENQIMHLLCEESSPHAPDILLQNRVFSLMDRQTTAAVEEILMESERQLKIKYTDSAYVGLMVHVSLAIKRIRNNEKIEMEQSELQRLMLLPEFSIAEAVCDQIQERFSIHIPRGEVGYITMHLSSARIWPDDNLVGRSLDRVHLRQLTRSMIVQVEEELHMDLSDSDSLLEDLCSHMAPMLSRLAMGIRIENSQLESIREEYPAIFRATVNACDVLCQEIGIAHMPEAEAAFLAMHFGAAVERKRQEQQVISAMVVCPTGVGTSRILAACLAKEFPKIQVMNTISAFRIDTEQLRNQGIDLIISTVQLTVDFPSICVSPVLQASDKRRLENMLLSLVPKSHTVNVYKKQMSMDDVAAISRMGEQMLALQKNFKLSTVVAAKTRSEVIAQAGALFAADDRMAAEIEAGLYERDQIADTYIKPLCALLLHCKTHAINQPQFGYLRLNPPVYENGKVMVGAAVMLIPEGTDTVAEQLMSAISASMVENHTLLNQLRTGSQEEILASIETDLGVFYKQFLKKRIGVG